MASYMHDVVVNHQNQNFGLRCYIHLDFLWWNHNCWLTISGFHTCLHGWRLATKSFVFTLVEVVGGTTSNNLKIHFGEWHMVFFGALVLKKIASKLITFGVDG